MNAKRIFMLILLLILALAACGPSELEPGAGQEPTPASEQAAAEALPAARQALADFLGIDPGAVQLDKIQDAEWPNGCLGLGETDEMCTEAIVPGYEFTFIVNGSPYAVRTDLTGNAVRVEAAVNTADPGEVGEQPAAVQAATAAIAAQTGLPAEQIELLSWEAREWPNACLGLAAADEMCAEVITPGYLVSLRTGEQLYNVRTDEAGSSVRVEEAAYPAGVISARKHLAQELGVPLLEIELLSFEAAEWSDSCLGLGGPAEICAAVITPGWRVMLAHAGATYEVRTDEAGTVVRTADPELLQPGAGAPLPDMGGAVAFYQRSGGIAGELLTVRIFADGTVERTFGAGEPDAATELFTVEPALVETLLAELEAAGYGELERSYLPQDPCCDRYFYLTAADLGGEIVAVETVDATEETPDALWRSIELLEQFVDRAAGQ